LQSRDVVNAFGLMTAIFMLQVFSPYMFTYLKQTYITYFSDKLLFTGDFTVSAANGFLRDFVIGAMMCTVPMMLIIMAASVILTGAQTRFKMTFSLLKPKFERVNPLKGLKKLFAIRSVVELFKAIIKMIIVIIVMYLTIMPLAKMLPSFMTADITESVFAIAGVVFKLFTTVSMMLIGFAILDYGYQWWEHKRGMRMTKQEIKQEYKQMEGDPHVRAHIKDVQKKMSMMRMIQRVPDASVVITNPTHFAVCIQYQPGQKGAPKVIAKGQDYMAFRIIEEAKKYDIERVENVPLARGLYAAVDIGKEIPAEFFHAVAEVLAYVYKLKKVKSYRR